MLGGPNFDLKSVHPGNKQLYQPRVTASRHAEALSERKRLAQCVNKLIINSDFDFNHGILI